MAKEQSVGLSAGQLHSAGQLLNVVNEMRLGTVAVVSEMRTVLVCPVDEVLNLCIRCGWMQADSDGALSLSSRGTDILALRNYELRLRHQLRDYVLVLRPSWSRLIPDGQRELARFAPANVVQCFDEAGVIGRSITDDLLSWWDDLANIARGFRIDKTTAVGRAAEKLSLEYETDRVGVAPIWESAESNLSGFDVLSHISRDDPGSLQIEVKGSQGSLDHASLHLTAWEWSVAQGNNAHLFHLWLLSTPPRLAVVSVPQMEKHVPKNLGLGEWETVAIPFRSFSGLFPS